MTGVSKTIIWQNGFAYEIGAPNTSESRAIAINDGGIAVRDAATDLSGREVHAFAWDRAVCCLICELGKRRRVTSRCRHVRARARGHGYVQRAAE